jgi:hypothetical protein
VETYQREFDREQDPAAPAAQPELEYPGRRSASAALDAPSAPSPSGIIRRKSSGAAADQKVMRAALDRASGGAGHGLPAELRARFEQSTGADLGGVRVHTGAESQAAAAAVGAKAYAVGTDIHFGAGQYDPGSASGQELLAHEVFHTLQAPQAGGGDGVELSEGHDADEVEADRGAAAMVAGEQAVQPTAAAGGVVRRKPNSYSEQKGLTWSGGTALQEDEITAWAAQKQSLVMQGLTYVGLAAGFKPTLGADTLIEKLEKDAMAEYNSRVSMMKASIEHLENELESADDKRTSGSLWWKKSNAGWEAYYQKVKKELASEEAILDALENGKEDTLAKATKKANGALAAINSFVGKANSLAKAINGETQTLNPSVFEDISTATSKIGKMTSVIEFGIKLLDRSKFTAFEKNPSEETAIAWARHVGSTFKSAGAFAEGLPGGWGTVISSMCAMPSIVTENFYSVMTKRYARIDAETRDDSGGSKMLEEGTSG